MVGKERYINSGAALMIHAPMVVAMGNANQLKDALGFLEGAQKRIVGLYADATGLPASEFEAIMTSGKDKWYNEDEAITASLATKKKDKPAIKAVLDTSLYNMTTLPDWLQVEDTTPESIRKAEKALTSSGLSRREAKAVLAGGWQAKEAPQDSERDAHANRLLKALTS